MGASAIEFRLRMAINAAIIILGFWAPWIEKWGIGRRMTLLEWLALELGRTEVVRFTVAVPVVIVVSALMAAVGAGLRVWGTAYLGAGTVNSLDMKAGVVADGPYRYVRNPLYIGLWFTVVAMGFVMPVTGALFAIVLVSIFEMRLILGEEAFLAARIGQTYEEYKRAVPRLIPRLRPTLAKGAGRPQWMRAALAELLPIGVFVSVAFLSWTYDNQLVGRAILISFGASLIARALLPQSPTEQTTTESRSRVD